MPPVPFGASNHFHLRLARFEDLSTLAVALGDPSTFFHDRFQRQQEGRGALFVALLDDQVVGTVYLWLDEAEESIIREKLANVPLLTHLKVHPDFRNQGFGTRLIAEVENMARGMGYAEVALAVEENNTEAKRLYDRLDYAEWPYGFVYCDKDVDLLGGEVTSDKCYVLTKQVGAVR